METARAANEVRSTAYDETLADFRERQRQVARRRFDRDLGQARSSSASAGFQRATSASPYSAGPSRAVARLEWTDDEYWTLRRSNPDVDLTRWHGMSDAGLQLAPVVAPLMFYPVLLEPGMRMAFARVGRSRVTYVWRGVRLSHARTIDGLPIHLRISFPDSQPNGSNLAVTFGWRAGADEGYKVPLRFDGECVLPIAEGALVGAPPMGRELALLIDQTYEDSEAWSEVLREVFSPVSGCGFRHEKMAEDFFPHDEWLRIDHVTFLEKSVFLIRPL